MDALNECIGCYNIECAAGRREDRRIVPDTGANPIGSGWYAATDSVENYSLAKVADRDTSVQSWKRRGCQLVSVRSPPPVSHGLPLP